MFSFMFSRQHTKRHGGRERPPHASYFAPCSVRRLAFCLRNRRIGDRRDVADRRCTGRKVWGQDKGLITLSLSRATGLASTSKGIPVGVGSRETIRECLQKYHDLVLLLIR